MKRSLHIGINDYPGTDSDLSGCVNDAKDWMAALATRGFSHQTEILDKNATKKAMVDAIEGMVALTGKDDISVITYSGHGTWVPDGDGDEADGRDECLCPWDIGTTGEVITDDELYEVFGSRKWGARIIFISDSCHSGSVSRMGRRSDDPFKNETWNFQQMKFLPPSFHLTEDGVKSALRVEKVRARSKIRAATVLLSGCADEEYSYDAYFNQRPNGALTYIALWCLGKMTAESTYQDWFNMIRKYLPHQYYPQTPQLSGSWTQRKKWKLFQE